MAKQNGSRESLFLKMKIDSGCPTVVRSYVRPSYPIGRFIVDSGQSWTRMALLRWKMLMLQDTNGPKNRSKMTATSVNIELYRNEAAE